MSSYNGVCGTTHTSEAAARREDLPSGPVEDEGTVPGDAILCSTLPGKANDIMPVLPLPHPKAAKGDRPDACRGPEGPWHRQGRQSREFPSSSCCSWPSYGRKQWGQKGNRASCQSQEHEVTAVRGFFKPHTDLVI